MDTTLAALSKAADQARGLAIDAIAACSSGHLGLPLGAAEIGAALFGQTLNYDPKDPKWINRDRFVLSAGHGSMFLYEERERGQSTHSNIFSIFHVGSSLDTVFRW